jgi:phage recombination protein Bet
MNATRTRTLATQEAQIESNIAKIEEAKRRPSALEAMAMRLNVSAGSLTTTLKQTVFKGASDSEFVALVVVANAYDLNPLLKEIYAFPAKGGGIIPYVSVDGWTRIINEHPKFDGLEFNDIVDEKGNLYAIESVIYRSDRSRPMKVTEYMDECKGQGPAWQKTPKRMLRHRALIQGARIAFGFSGIYADGDEPVAYVQQDGGDASRVLPSRRETQTAHNPETGEVLSEEELAALDRQSFADMEGRDDAEMGESHTDADPTHRRLADVMIEGIRAAKGNVDTVGEIMDAQRDAMKDWPAELREEVYAASNAALGRGAEA